MWIEIILLFAVVFSLCGLVKSLQGKNRSGKNGPSGDNRVMPNDSWQRYEEIDEEEATDEVMTDGDELTEDQMAEEYYQYYRDRE